MPCSSDACQSSAAGISSLSNQTLSPASRPVGLSSSRRFSSRAASVSTPEWLRKRTGCFFGPEFPVLVLPTICPSLRLQKFSPNQRPQHSTLPRLYRQIIGDRPITRHQPLSSSMPPPECFRH